MSRATDAREKGRIGILGSGLSYAGSYSRVTSETIGRDLNPLGRGDGNAYVGGQLNLGRITPSLPMSTAPGGWGNSVNNGCGDGGGESCSETLSEGTGVRPAPVIEDCTEKCNGICEKYQNGGSDCGSGRKINPCCGKRGEYRGEKFGKVCDCRGCLDADEEPWCGNDESSEKEKPDGMCWKIVPIESEFISSVTFMCDPGVNGASISGELCTVTGRLYQETKCVRVPCSKGGHTEAYGVAYLRSSTCLCLKSGSVGTQTAPILINYKCGSGGPSEADVRRTLGSGNVLNQPSCPCVLHGDPSAEPRDPRNPGQPLPITSNTKPSPQSYYLKRNQQCLSQL